MLKRKLLRVYFYTELFHNNNLHLSYMICTYKYLIRIYIIFVVSFVLSMECGTRYAINLNNVINKNNECILIVMHIQNAKIPLIILYISFSSSTSLLFLYLKRD